MKYCTILILTFIILSCSEKEEVFIPEKFVFEKIQVELPFEVRDIINYGKGYVFYSMQDTSATIGYLNDDFTLNDYKTKQLNTGQYEWYSAIWTSNDTLFAIIGGWPGYSIVFWKNNKWTTAKSGSTTKDTYMSTELEIPIYEDDDFIVNSCCRGEFGGAIFFNDKKTDKTFSCKATCLNGIQKLNDSFFVTSSIAHGSGYSRFIKIDNPRNLYELKKKEQLLDCSWYDIYPEDPREEVKHPKGHDKGYSVLLDTFDIHLIGAFEFKKQIYHFYSDDHNTYLGYIKNKNLVPLHTIVNKESWHGHVRDLKHNSNIFPIKSRDINGVIIVKGKKIKLVEFKRKIT